MYTVADKAQRPGEEAVQGLHNHEDKVKTHEVGYPPGVLFEENGMDQRHSLKLSEEI
jgi:hypothetical protein